MKPRSHSSYLRLQVLCERFYDADEKSNVLNDLSFVELKAHIPVLLSQVSSHGPPGTYLKILLHILDIEYH